MDDVQLGVPMPKTVDIPFAYVTLVFLILFTIEQVVRSVVQFDEYCFSFFWFMELVANASMILQLGPLMSPEGVCHQETNIASLLSSGGLAAGSRLARVMRLLRVIRVLRVFNSCSKQRNPNAAVHKNRQSAVGKRLNEMLVRSMIVIVIALLTIFPILSFEGVDTSRAVRGESPHHGPRPPAPALLRPRPRRFFARGPGGPRSPAPSCSPRERRPEPCAA